MPGWISAVVGHLSLAFVAATFVYVGHRRAEDVELAAGFGKLVALGPLLRFLDVRQATAPGGLHLAFDGLDLESIPRQRVEQRGIRALISSPLEVAEPTQPSSRSAWLSSHSEIVFANALKLPLPLGEGGGEGC